MGTVYSFRVEARNSYGYSTYSTEVSVLAASVPSQPAAPTTTVSGSNIVISWSLPSTNGSPIESYTITIRQSNGSTYSEQLKYCNGSNASIISARSCTIPTVVLTSAPFSLTSGSGVYAKVVAKNGVGNSSSSTAGNGATVP
jgi:hypothetical protein